MPHRLHLPQANAVLDYWIETVGPAGWYSGGEELDSDIRARFLDMWDSARIGRLNSWLSSPGGSLAFLILTDQFPRNMFRGEARAFATDPIARKAAAKAVQHEWDLRIPEPQRQFFYMPFMHAETNADQDRSVRLLLTRMPETGADNLLHARAHREVIRRFGRFPYRNDALGRHTTAAEAAYLEAGGYGSTVAALQAAA